MEEAGPSASGETPAHVGKKRYKSTPRPQLVSNTHLCSITWRQHFVTTCVEIHVIVPALNSILSQIVSALLQWLKLIVSTGTVQGNTVYQDLNEPV